MQVDRTRLIAALRDMAAKAMETKEVTVTDYQAVMSRTNFNDRETPTRTETMDAYSKEWIAGRLLGMADVIEALTSEETP